ncbi:MAG: hypothetical protein R6X23_08045 [Acidimicrobiia bacterium]
MELAALPEHFVATRTEVQRVATHVLARRRFDLVGKFGLRATPGGVGMPSAGSEHEVTRVAGTTLFREVTGSEAGTTTLDLTGATLADAAVLAGVDLTTEFQAGHDTPPVGDPAARLAIDPPSASALAVWFDFSWGVIDAVVASLPPEAEPSVLQLWPEHFDAGCDVAVSPGRRTNLGASPGDVAMPDPYLYVGPWDDARPGDTSYWNASFGAVLGYGDLMAADDPRATGIAFLRRGLELLAG